MLRMLITPKRMSPMKIKWFDKPQKHDYPAAASYLSLVTMPQYRRIFWKPRMNGGDFSQKPGAHSCSSSSPLAPGL
jgi:hypothetical protein